MARSYGQIMCSIWDDPEFCDLPGQAQRAYFMLVTQKEITACGSLPLTLRRWSRTLPERERDDLGPALEALAARRFILVDEDTEEVLVRTFAKHDGGYKHAKRAMAVVAYAKAIRSARLRCVVRAELGKLGLKIGNEEGLDSLSDANGLPTESGRFLVVSVSTEVQEPGTRNQEPGTESEHPSSADADTKQIDFIRDDVTRLCELLADLIEGNGSKRPLVTERWRKSARLMLDADKRTEEQIGKAIRWCQADEFWRGNILSMPKLREKYDQLRLAAQRTTATSAVPTTDLRVMAGMNLAARLRAEEANYSPKELQA